MQGDLIVTFAQKISRGPRTCGDPPLQRVAFAYASGPRTCGVIPSHKLDIDSAVGGPRMRGDPIIKYAGLARVWSPHMRGDPGEYFIHGQGGRGPRTCGDPIHANGLCPHGPWSPHMQGVIPTYLCATRRRVVHAWGDPKAAIEFRMATVVPAHAGSDPLSLYSCQSRYPWSPHMRGDPKYLVLMV